MSKFLDKRNNLVKLIEKSNSFIQQEVNFKKCLFASIKNSLFSFCQYIIRNTFWPQRAFRYETVMVIASRYYYYFER